jgi:hypothetical protein
MHVSLYESFFLFGTLHGLFLAAVLLPRKFHKG